MKMKKLNFCSIALFTLAMSACVNDADVATSSSATSSSSEGNTTFSFVVPNTSVATRTAETSGVYDQGTAEEYALKNVRVYLFDATTKNFYKDFTISVGTASLGDTSTGNYDVTYPASDKVEVKEGTYDIYAVANKTDRINATNELSFLSGVDSTTYAKGTIASAANGLEMTNRGTANMGVVIPQATSNTDVTNVTIKLERVVAKLMISKAQDAFNLKDPSGNVYATINLSNYRYFNLSKSFYTFRHVATLADGTDDANLIEPTWAVTDSYFSNIADVNGYCVDPYFFHKTVAGASTAACNYFFNPLCDNNSGNITSTLGTAGTYTSVYCLENCMYRPAQKHVYTTGIVFKANISVPDGYCLDATGASVKASDQSKLYYFNYKFYTSLEAVHNIGKANVPTDESQLTPAMQLKYGIKIFTKSEDGSFDCFYNYFIRHLPTSDATTMGVMEFGIVRNNIYSVSVSDISGLGSGTPDVTPTPDDKTTGLLSVTPVVVPWIVRDQSTVLGK